MDKRKLFHLHKDKIVWRKLWNALAITVIVGTIASGALANEQLQRASADHTDESSLAAVRAFNARRAEVHSRDVDALEVLTLKIPETNHITLTATTRQTSTSTTMATPSQTGTPTNNPIPAWTTSPTTIFALAVSPSLPDLTIANIRIELQNTSCFTPDDMLGVRVWVTNIGQAAAGRFVLKVNGAEQTVDGLAIDETQAFFFKSYIYGNPVTVIVDPTNLIMESNENNNTRSEMVPIPTLPLPCATPTFTPTFTPTPTPISSACGLYPIALHVDSLNGIAVGDIIPDIYSGSQPGNFGWLSWTGHSNLRRLAASLTLPGDSNTYINPDNPNDHVISIGDKIPGHPGIANGHNIRQALDALLNTDIMAPIWDIAEGSGNNILYRVAGFARIHLTSYHLPGDNWISAQFLGLATCE